MENPLNKSMDTVSREIFVGANFRIIDQNTLRINFRSFKFCMIYCTRARACRRFANIPRVDEKITPSCLEKCQVAAWLPCRDHTCRLQLLHRLELSVTPSPLALSLVTASLASFIVVGLTDVNSDPLGLGRSLRFEASAE